MADFGAGVAEARQGETKAGAPRRKVEEVEEEVLGPRQGAGRIEAGGGGPRRKVTVVEPPGWAGPRCRAGLRVLRRGTPHSWEGDAVEACRGRGWGLKEQWIESNCEPRARRRRAGLGRTGERGAEGGRARHRGRVEERRGGLSWGHHDGGDASAQEQRWSGPVRREGITWHALGAGVRATVPRKGSGRGRCGDGTQ